MAFTQQQLEKIKFSWEGFLIKRRPPVEIRDKVDLGMDIKDQTIIVYEIRSSYPNPLTPWRRHLTQKRYG